MHSTDGKAGAQMRKADDDDEAGETTVCRGALGAGRIAYIRAPACHPCYPAPAGLRPRRNGGPQVSPLARDQSQGRPQELDYDEMHSTDGKAGAQMRKADDDDEADADARSRGFCAGRIA